MVAQKCTIAILLQGLPQQPNINSSGLSYDHCESYNLGTASSPQCLQYVHSCNVLSELSAMSHVQTLRNQQCVQCMNTVEEAS